MQRKSNSTAAAAVAVGGARPWGVPAIGWDLGRATALPMMLLVLGVATEELGWRAPEVVLAWLCLAPMVVHLAARFGRDFAAALPRPGARRAAIVCASAPGRGFRATLSAMPETRFFGFFDDRAAERLGLGAEEHLLGPASEVPRLCREGRIDVVYVALPLSAQSRVSGLLAQLWDTTASVYWLPDPLLFGPVRPSIQLVAGTPVVRMCETPFLGAPALVKRAEDLLLGGLLLIACLPLLLAIAAAVKLDSPGPVIFRQRRHGLDGREIVVDKFRTMTVLEDGLELRQARCSDPRVTRVGAFLRRFSLDELPQLVNVLQGRMSLVGPRPHALAHTELYRKLVSGYMIRHKVRPGITGWAQVNGLRGETDSVEKMRARVEHDLAYLADWSLALDLRILARTVWAVIRGDNAY